ncbi:MAG: MTAP family purine nucleoside phosphorylase [Candidatus Glassbacteria bacterium]|nr:MTAP family purine nucleoside phosphorylase [Candidatus Glassbacteria bacterium]
MAVIGGSGAYELDLGKIGTVLDEIAVDTPFGRVDGILLIEPGEHAGPLAFVSRHGREGYRVGAWDVNYRALIYALKEIGTTRLIAWSGPGAVDQRFEPGDYVLPDGIIDLTRHRQDTFYHGTGLGFIRQHPVFCPDLHAVMLRVLASRGNKYHDGGVYAATEGPRLETADEVRMISRLGGDLVGMTLAPEVFLARELEICYHPLCYVANWAEGVGELPFRGGELFEGMLEGDRVERVGEAVQGLADVVRELAALIDPSAARQCPCSQAMLRYRREGRVGEDWHGWIGLPE